MGITSKPLGRFFSACAHILSLSISKSAVEMIWSPTKVRKLQPFKPKNGVSWTFWNQVLSLTGNISACTASILLKFEYDFYERQN